MIADVQIDKAFWGFAVATAAHIHNRIPSRSDGDISPLQHRTGNPPSIGYLHVFGSVTYTLIPAEKRRKLDPKSAKCILLGYDEEAGSKVYLVYDQGSKQIFCSSDVIIDKARRKLSAKVLQKKMRWKYSHRRLEKRESPKEPRRILPNKIVTLQLGMNQTSKGLVAILLLLDLYIMMMSLEGEWLVFEDRGGPNAREILRSTPTRKLLVL